MGGSVWFRADQNFFAVESSGQPYQIVMTGKYPAKLPKHFDYKA
jgi:hypothetical protein